VERNVFIGRDLLKNFGKGKRKKKLTRCMKKNRTLVPQSKGKKQNSVRRSAAGKEENGNLRKNKGGKKRLCAHFEISHFRQYRPKEEKISVEENKSRKGGISQEGGWIARGEGGGGAIESIAGTAQDKLHTNWKKKTGST